MSSRKQIETNRPSASKSTGGSTEGKPASAPLAEGMVARYAVLPGESVEEFRQLCANLEAEWQPQGCTECFMLEMIAVNEWRLRRYSDFRARIIAEVTDNKEQMALLVKLSRTQKRIRNGIASSKRELASLQKYRRPDRAARVRRPLAQTPGGAAPSQALDLMASLATLDFAHKC